MSSSKKPSKKEKKFSQKDYTHPAAAWGAALSVGRVLIEQGAIVEGTKAIFTMNQEKGGFDCPGCAWPDDRKGLHMDICENGVKHVTWEMTKKRVTPEFFAEHTVTELESWSDFELENAGRLTEPMIYDSSVDKYKPISWSNAFALMGDHLNSLSSPNEASFYTSGRLSNEATFLYQLFAREYGTNNMPDCSNMCHEASGRALSKAIGTGKGTTDLVDWQNTDAIFLLGVNVATNAPRMLTALADGVKHRGTKIVHINPLIEVAATRAITPHEIFDMMLFKTTVTSSLNVQPNLGGDFALVRGISKYLFEQALTDPTVLDMAFIEQHTAGFAEYKAICEQTDWTTIIEQSGASKAQIVEAAEIYRTSKRTIIAWCLGITQHGHSVDMTQEFVNLLLLRGNIGREGAGPCPIRGHSNVQGNRTCGVNNKPNEAWLARMDAATNIKSPREIGLDTVRTIEAMHNGTCKFFLGMGGNFAIATPDTELTFEALRRCDMTVHVSTKLNRSHVIHGKQALILPCLGRTEFDNQASGPQSVSVEDSMSMVHLSKGMNEPASEHLKSECAIICGLARATLKKSVTPWQNYEDNYDTVRDTMSHALFGFEDFNRRVRQPLGFRIAQPARELDFQTPTARANFSLAPLPNILAAPGRLKLATMRSHDQFNTTIYSDNDRYRGIHNLRKLLLMNEQDMKNRGLNEFDLIEITSYAKDGATRSVRDFRAVKYNVPQGSTLGYMPELNYLCAISSYSGQSDQPLMKQLIVDVKPQTN